MRTTVVERTERLMPWLDPEMTRILDYHVQTHDVDLRLGTSAKAVRDREAGGFEIDLSDGTSVEADVVVMAVGPAPTPNWPATPGSRSAPAAASWSTPRCGHRIPTSSPRVTQWRPPTC
jgi:cation diffusion facilitator CzcD-associated flavoprotein CzcO